MNFLTRMWKQLCCNANPGRIFSSKSDQECISDFCNSAFECTAFYLSKSNLKKVLAYNSTRWQKIWVGWLGEKVASRSEFLFMRSSKVPQMEDLVDDQDALTTREVTWEKFLSMIISKPLLGGGGVILCSGWWGTTTPPCVHSNSSRGADRDTSQRIHSQPQCAAPPTSAVKSQNKISRRN